MKKIQFFKWIVVGIFCGFLFLDSEAGENIYAKNISAENTSLTENDSNIINSVSLQEQLPTGLLSVTEETDVMSKEDEGNTVENLLQDRVETYDVRRAAESETYDWDQFGSHYFYDQLTAEEQEYWDALDEICSAYLTTEEEAVKTSSGGYRMKAVWDSGIETDSMDKIVRMFRYSNPQYYFLGTSIYTITKGSQKSKVWSVYPAFGEGAARAEATEAVKTQVDTWQKKVNDCATEDEKVQMIHDLIIRKVEYNHDIVNNNYATENTEFSQSAYSVFCSNKTVCAGYSQAFEMMCNGAGIDAVAVTSSEHEWNKVQLEDGYWYNVDCTWGDGGSGGDNIIYIYFLRSDAYYEKVSSYSKRCHTEESYWEGYLPVTERDSAAPPVISVTETEDGSEVSIHSYDQDVKFYYTADQSDPAISDTRTLYQSEFAWDSLEYPVIKVVSTAEGKHNSAVVTQCVHDYQSDILVAASCEKTGTKSYTCTVCGVQYMEEIPAAGHTEVTDAAVAATCETAGLTEGSHCSVCGKVLTEQTEIPAAGHTVVIDEGVEAACETAGLTEGSHCSVCGKVLTKQEEIPAAGHTVVTDAGVAATCETAGHTEGSHCSVCGKVLKEQTEIPAAGHTEVKDAAVTPTCETAGYTEGSHCSVCGKVLTKQEEIPAAGHKVVTDAGVAATCETAGHTEGSHCGVCGKVLTEQTEIPAAGHTWSEYKENGELKRKCSVCGKTESISTLPEVKTVQLSKTSYTYDGKVHMPAVKVTDTAGTVLKEGTDYSIKKPSGRKNAGIYTITIMMKGDYTGQYQQTYQIVPKGTTISGVTAKKKAFTVSWKKQEKQTTGYQIQYAVDAKFKKAVRTKNISSTKKVKQDVSKLKAGKKYYVRIRTCKTVKVNGKAEKVYSSWSNAKTVKIK